MLLITSFMLSAPESSSSSVSLAGRGAPLLAWVSTREQVVTGGSWGGALLQHARRVTAGCSGLSAGSFAQLLISPKHCTAQVRCRHVCAVIAQSFLPGFL